MWAASRKSTSAWSRPWADPDSHYHLVPDPFSFNQFVPGMLTEHGNIDLGQRIGGDDLQHLAAGHFRGSPAGTHHRLGAHQSAAINLMVDFGKFIHE